MPPVCSHCNVPSDLPGLWYLDRFYCTSVCSHAAGDRSACGKRDCGCTRYSKKRRLLRDHRACMRVMEELIEEHGLSEDLDNAMVAQTGNTSFFLGIDSWLDETSDTEDPEATLLDANASLRSEVADVSTMVQAVQGSLECQQLRRDLEHARMALEDMRSRQLRSESRQ